ncbi:hypothetical protein Q604_UNBC17797G0001, partial [human gut metagenome]
KIMSTSYEKEYDFNDHIEGLQMKKVLILEKMMMITSMIIQ